MCMYIRIKQILTQSAVTLLVAPAIVALLVLMASYLPASANPIRSPAHSVGGILEKGRLTLILGPYESDLRTTFGEPAIQSQEVDGVSYKWVEGYVTHDPTDEEFNEYLQSFKAAAKPLL